MQVTLNPSTPAEVRLVAAFMQDLADYMEGAAEAVIAETVAPAPLQEDKPKRSRKQPKEDPPAPTEQETPSATTAETPAESGSEAPAPADIPENLDHDALRVLFGELTNAGKRQEGIAAVTKLGFKSIKDIPDDKLADAWTAMKAVME